MVMGPRLISVLPVRLELDPKKLGSLRKFLWT